MPDHLPQGTKITVEEAKDKSEVTSDGNLMIVGDVFDVTIFGQTMKKFMVHLF